jgi:hypothetical protein
LTCSKSAVACKDGRWCSGACRRTPSEASGRVAGSDNSRTTSLADAVSHGASEGSGNEKKKRRGGSCIDRELHRDRGLLYVGSEQRDDVWHVQLTCGFLRRLEIKLVVCRASGF